MTSYRGYWKVRIQFQALHSNKETRNEGFCDLGHVEMKLWAAQILLFRGTQCVSFFLSLMGYSNVIAHGLLKREYITMLHALVCMEIWKGKGEWKASLCRDERKFCTLWKYTSLNEDVGCSHQHVDRIVEVQRFRKHSLSVATLFFLRFFLRFFFSAQGCTDSGRQVGITDVRFLRWRLIFVGPECGTWFHVTIVFLRILT